MTSEATIPLEGTDRFYDEALAQVHAEMEKLQELIHLGVVFIVAPIATSYFFIRAYQRVSTVLRMRHE